MSNNKGIPTIGVRGIQFRSRIEAQWAYIFEKLGWNWEYEAIDLNGYIPDFIVKFGDEEFLIEIKGNTNIWKEEVYKPHKEKIITHLYCSNINAINIRLKKHKRMESLFS